MPFSISRLLSSLETDIGQRVLTRGRYRSKEYNSPDKEKDMQ